MAVWWCVVSDDIVERLRNVAPYAKAQDPFTTDPYYFSLTGLVSGAASEIRQLRADRDRWQAIAFCRTCEPADGYYCTRHRQDEEGTQ